ncbi:unnamed protein product [Boreogadus saida]
MIHELGSRLESLAESRRWLYLKTHVDVLKARTWTGRLKRSFVDVRLEIIRRQHDHIARNPSNSQSTGRSPETREITRGGMGLQRLAGICHLLFLNTSAARKSLDAFTSGSAARRQGDQSRQ